MNPVEDFKQRVAKIDKNDCDAYFKIDELCFGWFKYYFQTNNNQLAIDILDALKKEIT